MKKNRMMRLASTLLVAVLLTTSMISGTFAKYVTEKSSTDTARVAKWGVEITASGDAFAKTYASETSGYTESTVISDVKVVAPGTEGTLTDLKVEGTPEVAVAVTYDAELTLTDWALSTGDIYFPIVITVEGTDYAFAGGDATALAAYETTVETAIENCKKNYPANVAIDTSSDAPSVSWAWKYYDSDANDKKDTELGDRMAKGVAAPTIKLDIKTTATQID